MSLLDWMACGFLTVIGMVYVGVSLVLSEIETLTAAVKELKK